MIEPKRHNVVWLSPVPGILVNCEEVQCPAHRTPLRLTISVEKIDRLLAEIQKEVECLLEEMMALRLVRTQLADYEDEHWGDR